MSRANKQLILRLAFIVSIMFVGALAPPGCRKKTVEQTRTENNQNKSTQSAPAPKSPSKVVTPTIAPKKTLREIVRAARTWRPGYISTYGGKAPDFTITDINGKQHTLSDYRGKDVIITFWATWCGPCKIEVPHLIALRNLISKDKLAMLAISYISAFPPENTEMVKEFVEQNEINYTVFSVEASRMPPLFSRISTIPCSFFINPEGNIKLATNGLLSLDEIKAIIQAKSSQNSRI